MPVLRAATGRSVITAVIWALRASGDRASTRLTPVLFWAVMQLMAEQPYTFMLVKVLRSAWMPAPPLESLPPIVMAMAGVIGLLQQ